MRAPTLAVVSLLLTTPLAAQDATMQHATGTFDVELTPQSAPWDTAAGIARMSIAKRFHGDLEGTSTGEMLAAMTDVEGSAAYVAIETVTGILHGRSGTFVLQHSGTMSRGEQRLSVRVVPDSGTGDLTGLEGEMTIEIADGVHAFAFEYSLPGP